MVLFLDYTDFIMVTPIFFSLIGEITPQSVKSSK